MTPTLLTIGHSNHPISRFTELLRRNQVTALADVRSAPFSRYAPQFNRGNISDALKSEGIHYVFLGDELGARSDNSAHYRDGRAQYQLMAKEPRFQEGLDRLRKGVATQRIALMCSEKDPLECHRTFLVGVRVRSPEIALAHILADGAIEPHEEAEKRLLALHGLNEADLFRTPEQRLAEAYRLQCLRIQYEDKKQAITQRVIPA